VIIMERSKNSDTNNAKGIRRPDAVTVHKAVEIDRVGRISSLREVIHNLKSSDKPQKILIVPAHSMNQARIMLKDVGVAATVRN
jgi:hypothetical protein